MISEKWKSMAALNYIENTILQLIEEDYLTNISKDIVIVQLQPEDNTLFGLIIHHHML